MVTFIPVWIIQDILVIIATIITVIFIVRNEKHPEIYLLEMACFCLLYAGEYENFATLVGYYGYGQSLIMILNVPITIPLIEYIIVYASLRFLNYMKTPTWSKPFIVGFFGMIFDFTMDPVSTKQIFNTAQGIIGRWTWFIGPNSVNIYGEPVYNFTGWVLLCGYAALFLILGRVWYKRSNYKPIVGYVYPVIAMICSLIVLVLPSSQFLLWLAPIFSKGSIGEWIMLAVFFVVPILLLIFAWHGKMKTTKNRSDFKKDYPIFIIFVGFPIVGTIFTLIGAYWEILWLEILFTIIPAFLVYFIGSRVKSK